MRVPFAGGLSDPELAREYWMRLAAIEERLGKVTEAAASYEKSLALDDTLADAHYNLARVREQLGDKRGALRHYSAYRRLTR